MLTLAIIGRPNVGKSTLFNTVIGKQLAIVHDRPGVTRDWRQANATLYGDTFEVIDTAGLEDDVQEGTLPKHMYDGTLEALDRCDIALFLIDGRAGITGADREFASMMRKAKIPVLLGVTKAETQKSVEDTLGESYSLGLGEPIPMSAAHNIGMDLLHGALSPYLDEHREEDKDEGDLVSTSDEIDFDSFDDIEGVQDYEFKDMPDAETRPIKLAIVGRPNVGKSTLLNTLIGQNRSLTGEMAGVTRDAVSVSWTWEGREINLVDTAGLRKKSKVHDTVEHMASQDSFRAIRLAQVVALVIDATIGVEKQDIAIAGHALREGRALILVVNKWDIAKDKAAILDEIKYKLIKSLGQAGDIPVVTLSALTGRRTIELMKAALSLYQKWNARVGTGALNRWLANQSSHHPPPLVGGKPNKLKYITQIKARPPRFVLWTSRPDEMPQSYVRYLSASLRRDFDMAGVALRIDLRKSKNPYT